MATLKLLSYLFFILGLLSWVGYRVVVDYWSTLQQISQVCHTLARENQIFQMVMLSGGGYLVAMATIMLKKILGPMIGGMWSSITIENKDPNFDAVVDYIADKLLAKVQGGQNSMQASTVVKKKTGKDWIKRYLGSDNKDVDNFEYRPDSNTAAYKFTYKGKTIFLSRTKGAPLMGGYSSRPFTPETLTLSVLGQDNELLKELLQEALAARATKDMANSINIYVQSTESWITGWELAMSKKARDKDSVILDMDLLDTLLCDARKFLQSGKWYLDLGIPYRRGYLLYGPPGCGKTSFAQVLAGELRLDLCILNLTHEGLNDNQLAAYFRDAPAKSIIVLEDVDSVFVERESTNTTKKSGGTCNVSFSGLLNAIDGVASQEGRLFFMTTNHIEKLDPALIRPGRCDIQLELKRASKLQMERMFLRFFPEEIELSREFSRRLPANELTMATLQGHFLKSRKAQECIDNTVSLLQESKPVFKPLKTIYEHFRRVGLERYAPILEYHGMTYTIDLANFNVDKMKQLSVEFSYHPSAQQTMKLLLDEDDTLLKHSYAFAEVATIREMFLASYPTDHEQVHGERAPYFRRKQASLQDVSAEKRASSDGHDSDGDDPPLKPSPVMKMIRSLSSESRSSESPTSPEMKTLLSRAQTDLTHEELDALCNRLCELLTRNGKGIISHHNLRVLLHSFPKRPVACVEAAGRFVRERNSSELLPVHLDLYSFLKRAGCAKYLHTLRITSLEQLLKKGKDKSASELALEWSQNCDMPMVDASTLAEIVTRTESVSGSLMRFCLYPRSRIMQCFELFYTIGIGSEKVASNSDSSGLPANSDIGCPRKLWTANELEDIAFTFAAAISDDNGYSVVSLIEVEKYLQDHRGDPLGALRAVTSDLINPPKPEPIPRPPPPPEPTDWVVYWLKSAGDGYAGYANSFINEGLATRENLGFGSVLADDVLMNVLGVRKLGHRRKLIAMHAELLLECAKERELLLASNPQANRDSD